MNEYAVETLALPTSKHMIEYVAMPGQKNGKSAQPPKRKKAKVNKARETLQRAADEYKRAYKDVYGLAPRLTYDGTWIRMAGEAQGMNLQRLKERTQQLKNRRG